MYISFNNYGYGLIMAPLPIKNKYLCLTNFLNSSNIDRCGQNVHLQCSQIFVGNQRLQQNQTCFHKDPLLLLLICIPDWIGLFAVWRITPAHRCTIKTLSSDCIKAGAGWRNTASSNNNPWVLHSVTDTRSPRSCIFFHNDFEWRLLERHSLLLETKAPLIRIFVWGREWL